MSIAKPIDNVLERKELFLWMIGAAPQAATNWERSNEEEERVGEKEVETRPENR